jgi:glycosyltransferase involved in cell wall biosynthesis
MKHNPELILALAEHWRDQKPIRVVVVSEGPGADWLQQQIKNFDIKNLSVWNFQPYEVYPSVLASADVLITILNLEAGLFSVPSKVLTYLCAQRPVLLAVPEENLIARTVRQNQLGLVVNPNNPTDFLNASDLLFHDDELRSCFANNGRQYAEKHFDIENIADRFEQLLR